MRVTFKNTEFKKNPTCYNGVSNTDCFSDNENCFSLDSALIILSSQL